MKRVLTLIAALLLGGCSASPASTDELSSVERWKELRDRSHDARRAGRMERAIERGEEALNFARENLGGKHTATGASIMNLAALYHAEGRFEEALTFYLELVEFSRELLGEEHPWAIETEATEAWLLYLQCRPEESVRIYRALLQRLGEKYDETSDYVLEIREGLAYPYKGGKRDRFRWCR